MMAAGDMQQVNESMTVLLIPKQATRDDDRGIRAGACVDLPNVAIPGGRDLLESSNNAENPVILHLSRKV